MQIPIGKSTPKSSVQRCSWATTDLLIGYHDREWGVPVHEDRVLFEFLILEGMQAGLSWETVLKKRENYRAAFDNFDVVQVCELLQAQHQFLARQQRLDSEPPQD
jgi:DNA-3-methyladenine glycosylase I